MVFSASVSSVQSVVPFAAARHSLLHAFFDHGFHGFHGWSFQHPCHPCNPWFPLRQRGIHCSTPFLTTDFTDFTDGLFSIRVIRAIRGSLCGSAAFIAPRLF